MERRNAADAAIRSERGEYNPESKSGVIQKLLISPRPPRIAATAAFLSLRR
jgi:hypothetical protein